MTVEDAIKLVENGKDRVMSARNIVHELFPDADDVHKFLLEGEIQKILESKDLGSFKGDISVFKKAAIDTASKLPSPRRSQKSLEKDALKRLNSRLDKLESTLLGITRKYQSGDLSRTKFRDRMKTELRIEIGRASCRERV